MQKKLIYTFVLLLLLTLVTVVITNSSLNFFIKKCLILILFSVKFLLVAFQFMELKKAHSFWIISIITFLIITNFIIIIS